MESEISGAVDALEEVGAAANAEICGKVPSLIREKMNKPVVSDELEMLPPPLRMYQHVILSSRDQLKTWIVSSISSEGSIS